jgi:hypothetical protein
MHRNQKAHIIIWTEMREGNYTTGMLLEKKKKQQLTAGLDHRRFTKQFPRVVGSKKENVLKNILIRIKKSWLTARINTLNCKRLARCGTCIK